MPKIEVPEELFCPITHEIFKEPVIAEDGFTYEKCAIEQWVAKNNTSPMTREQISNKFIKNQDKKWQIEKFFEKSQLCTNEQFVKAVLTGEINQVKNLNFLETHLHANKNHMKWTPLHYAASEGHKAIAKLLIDLGASTEPKSYNGWTPLHVAIEHNYGQMVNLLLSLGANIEAKTDEGETPLYIAAMHNRNWIVELLLQSGAIVEAKTKTGRTALCEAIEQNNERITKMLLEKGADYKIAINLVGKMNTSSTIFLLIENKRMREIIEQQQQKIDYLDQKFNAIINKLQLNDTDNPPITYNPQFFNKK